jgi:hypothetical protein
VIWTEKFPGAWANHLCECHPPEYWAQKADESIEKLMVWVNETRNDGGDSGGEMEYAGGQEHQLF